MDTLQQMIYAPYDASVEAHRPRAEAADAEDKRLRERIEMRQRQIERLERKLAKARAERPEPPHWIHGLVAPLAKRLAEHLPGYDWEVLGPFGVNSTVSIHFEPSDRRERGEDWAKHLRSITFRPTHTDAGATRLRLVDYSRNLKLYPEGTMGEMNGCNYPTEPCPDEMTLKQLLAWVK